MNWNPFLCNDLIVEFERLQRSVSKTIFGFKMSYENALEISGLNTLEKRIEILIRNYLRLQSEIRDLLDQLVS